MDRGHAQLIIGLMKQVNIKLDKNIKKYFCDCSLTIPQMTVLTLLHQNGGMKISDISSRMDLTNGTMTGIIDRLERMELVKRIRLDQDRRVIRVVLTEKANALSNDFDTMLCHCFADIFGSVPEEDLNTIVDGLMILNSILDNMEKLRDKGGVL